ncbi:MAG: PilT/PilU family type 4a pilus ATPase [Candidatus Peribacteraceae bacterium]|nr:PilT/PilU family type 4a pilus ATPase [Candidatus Peribacteraceae bacterium]
MKQKSSLPSLWQTAIDMGASDIHVLTDQIPRLRVSGKLLNMPEAKPLAFAEVKQLILEFVTEGQYKKFMEVGDIDCSFAYADGTRFRINCHMVAGEPAFAARLVPQTVPTPEDVFLPGVVLSLAQSLDGLILFTGPTGAGKSTSLAAILHKINELHPVNIITLEDPVEFIFKSDKALISQRELGTDFQTFPDGLRHVLRQDPDIVMVGEMRDLDSISLALTLAETGHLVLATLHTPNAMQSLDRIIDVFPSHQQTQIRMQLALSLRAIVAQRLVPRKGGGRIANREILIRTPAVSNIIREDRFVELESVMQTNQELGMLTFEKDLNRMIAEGLVDPQDVEYLLKKPSGDEQKKKMGW